MSPTPAPDALPLSDQQLATSLRVYLDALRRGASPEELKSLAFVWTQEVHRRWPRVFRAPD
ncbi:MAG: hypothetical protein M3Z21_17125 [Pseudomonadota bacterium]|nr:hypothetical protein [Pseudomonadota bacterium]